VQLAHSRDDGLAGLFVGAHPKRRVLFDKRIESSSEFVLVSFSFRLDGDVDDRLREDERLQLDRLVD